MGKVPPIKYKGNGALPAAGAHINGARYALLMIFFSDLTILHDSEPYRTRAAQSHKLTTKLNAVLARVEPPKGVA